MQTMNRRTIITVAAGAAAASIAGATAASAAIPYTISPEANLRSGPSTAYAVIRLLPQGAAVSGTGETSGSYYQVVHNGTTGWVHGYHLKKADATTSPADARQITATRTGLTFTYGSRSSRYHVIANGIDWSKPVGAVFYLDGDYAYKSRSRGYNPSLPAFIAMASEANRRNLLFIPLDTPDVFRSGLGYTWWYRMDANAVYFRSFARQILGTYRIDRTRLWLYGYSGGAELISIGLMNQYQTSWGFSGGGAIILAGGGAPQSYATPSASYLNSMRATWVVSSEDVSGQTVPATWSAYSAARAGYNFYRGKKMANARLSVLTGLGHLDYDLASVMRAPLDAAGLTRMR